MRLPTSRQRAYLAASAVLFVLLIPLGNDLERRRMIAGAGTTGPLQSQSSDPWTFMGTFMLSGFRPVAVNYLWVKATTLVSNKDWWELRPVFEMLSHLQPYNPEVWVYNAWNMSYNIPVEMTNNADRWRWIREGERFAQRGRALNPDSDSVALFMAHIYYNKLWQHPSLLPIAEKELGKPPLQLAIEVTQRAYESEVHDQQICLLRRIIHIRRGMLALARGAGREAAEAHLAEADATRRHIEMAHPQVKMALATPSMRTQIFEAAMTWEPHFWRGMRDELKEDLSASLDPDGPVFERRWAEVLSQLDQTVRLWDLLIEELDLERGRFDDWYAKAGPKAETAPERLMLMGYARATHEVIEQWVRFSRIMRELIIRLKAVQPDVLEIWRAPDKAAGDAIFAQRISPEIVKMRNLLRSGQASLTIRLLRLILRDVNDNLRY